MRSKTQPLSLLANSDSLFLHLSSKTTGSPSLPWAVHAWLKNPARSQSCQCVDQNGSRLCPDLQRFLEYCSERLVTSLGRSFDPAEWRGSPPRTVSSGQNGWKMKNRTPRIAKRRNSCKRSIESLFQSFPISLLRPLAIQRANCAPVDSRNPNGPNSL
jgi:hypothetical protein